jgi:DNA-binding PadR family transcriptional regulator
MSRALGEFEQMILFALVELGEEAYGAAIARTIETRTGRSVAPGAIYTALDRMQARGLVRSEVGEPTPERGGRRKKFYALEPDGAVELHRSVERIKAMSEGLMPKLETLLGSRVR